MTKSVCEESSAVRKIRVLCAITFIVCLSFLAFKDSYYAGDPINVHKLRQPGEPLNGYWYLAGTEGCFQNERVFSFSEDGIVTVVDGLVEKQANMTLKREHNSLVFVGKPKAGVTYKYYLEDNGNELTQTRMMSIDNSQEISVDERKSLFLRCDQPTNSGKFLSLFFRTFDPSELLLTKG